MSTTYKYTIVSIDEDLLNSLGAQGWRVAQVIPALHVTGQGGDTTGAGPRLLLELREEDLGAGDVVIDSDAVGRMLGDLFGHTGTLPPGT